MADTIKTDTQYTQELMNIVLFFALNEFEANR